MKYLSTTLSFFAAIVFLAGSTSVASAQVCAPQDEGEHISDRQLLRQTALDLLGRVPTLEEWQILAAGAAVSDMRDDMLASEAYFARVRQRHQDLLWANLDTASDRLYGSIRRLGRTTGDLWRLPSNATVYRGSTVCYNQPQPAGHYDSTGRPLPINADGTPATTGRMEGYVMVAPYWDMDNPIKVCAYDAMDAVGEQTSASCDAYDPYGDARPDCGCGPNLRRCGVIGVSSATQRPTRDALHEEPARIFEHIVREGLPYHEAFTTRTSFVNGYSSYFYRTNTGSVNYADTSQIYHDTRYGEVPAIPWGDGETWQSFERDEVHSGVLTTPAYLIRFGSNRGRVNHFYSTFLCQPFLPSGAGIPEETNPHPDLQQREGCKNCHVTIEPQAHRFGRWRTNGQFGFLDETALPTMPDEDWRCSSCVEAVNGSCASYCRQYAVTADNAEEAELLGARPLTSIYLADDELDWLNSGPSGIVEGREAQIAGCTARTLAQDLLGRELSETEEVEWLPSVVEDYIASGYNYTDLVVRLLEDEKYRVIR